MKDSDDIDVPQAGDAHGSTGDRRPHVEQVTELFRTHNAALVGFLSKRLGSSAEAQEVAQEAYVRLLGLEHPEQVSYLRAYLFHIASLLAIDRQRQQRRNTAAAVPVQDLFEKWLDVPMPYQHALAADQLQAVRQALRQLPAKTSQAFVLYALEDRSFGEVASIMHLTERMVRYHVTRAMAHCRAHVDMQEDAR